MDPTDLGHPFARADRPGGMELVRQVRDGSKSKKAKKESVLHMGYQVLGIHAVGLQSDVETPLRWNLYSHGEERLQHQTWYALALQQLADVAPSLPEDAIYVFDRGFDNRTFLRGVDELELGNAVVRMKIGRTGRMAPKIIDGAGQARRLRDVALGLKPRLTLSLDPKPGTKSKKGKTKRRKRKKKLDLSVGFAPVWMRDSSTKRRMVRREGGEKTLMSVQHPKGGDPIVLLVNRKVSTVADARTLARAYMRRWRIEEAFRRYKSENGFGYGIENSARSRKFRGQRRLLFLAMLLASYTASIRARGEEVMCALARKSRVPGRLPTDLLYRVSEVIGRVLWRTPTCVLRRVLRC